MPQEPLVGLISDHSSLVLAGDIHRAGYRVIRVLPEELIPDQLQPVDAWVVDCINSDEVAEATAWLEPRVLALSNRPDPYEFDAYSAWCERIITTLDKWTAGPFEHGSQQTRTDPGAFASVQAVWLLAGSTGGVAAIQRFLASFTHVPPVAFVMAQHIHPAQQSSLLAIGHANRDITCSLALGRHWLNPGHLLIVPASCRLKFSRQGEISSTRAAWDGLETPGIDQLMLDMCGMRPAPSGAIVFSGAGRDGCRGLAALASVGTKIWAQQPASCEAPSMPQAALDAGLPSAEDTPEGLAARFMTLYPRALS